MKNTIIHSEYVLESIDNDFVNLLLVNQTPEFEKFELTMNQVSWRTPITKFKEDDRQLLGPGTVVILEIFEDYSYDISIKSNDDWTKENNKNISDINSSLNNEAMRSKVKSLYNRFFK